MDACVHWTREQMPNPAHYNHKLEGLNDKILPFIVENPDGTFSNGHKKYDTLRSAQRNGIRIALQRLRELRKALEKIQRNLR